MYETYQYHPDTGIRTGLSVDEIAQAIKDERSLLWIDMSDIDDNDIDLLTVNFNLHPLTVEDLVMPNPRPKIEKFPGYIFLIFFSLESTTGCGSCNRVKLNELDFCLGKNYLVSFHNNPVNTIATCKERVKKQSPMMMHGADMLLYSILDSCVDSYLPVLQDFDHLVDQMSDELFKMPDQSTLKKIYDLKNEVLYLRRAIGPQADVINLVTRGDFELISQSGAIYFRGIYDNLVRLNDLVGTSRDIISGALEAYVLVVSNRLNEIMKTLTVIATIMMPLTLIASIYGMNFKHMPELEHHFGYPAVLLTMACIMISMLIFFKRRKWI